MLGRPRVVCVAKNQLDPFSRFETDPKYDGQTDRQTDRIAVAYTAVTALACNAPSGKNRNGNSENIVHNVEVGGWRTIMRPSTMRIRESNFRITTTDPSTSFRHVCRRSSAICKCRSDINKSHYATWMHATTTVAIYRIRPRRDGASCMAG